MRPARSIVLAIFIISFVTALAGGLFWANLRYAQHQPGGRDFIILWNGVRGFLMEGVSPYTNLVTLRIQHMVYGNQFEPGFAPLNVDMPFYHILLFLPFGGIADFAVARAVWMLFLEIALAGLTMASLSLLRWTPGAIMTIVVLLFGIFWVHGLWPLTAGSLAIFASLLLMSALLALRADIDELAGGLLALATFRVEAGIIFVIFIFLWCTAQKRTRVFYGYGMTLAVLLAIAFLITPDWVMPWLRAVLENLRQGPALSARTLLEMWFPGFGSRLGLALTVIILTILGLEWRLALKREFRSMLWTASLTLAATPLLGIPTTPSNYITLLLPLLLTLSVMDGRWGIVGRITAVLTLTGLFFGPWILFFSAIDQIRTFLFPLPLILIGLLYWVRWWAIRPPRTLIDTFSHHHI